MKFESLYFTSCCCFRQSEHQRDYEENKYSITSKSVLHCFVLVTVYKSIYFVNQNRKLERGDIYKNQPISINYSKYLVSISNIFPY